MGEGAAGRAGVVLYPHAALAQGAAPRAWLDDSVLAAGAKLLAAMDATQAWGLAAQHIGLVEPVIALNLGEDGAGCKDTLLYNPRVLAVADETARGPEGSVSLPGIEVEIERPVWALIGYDDAEGQRREQRFSGFQARCALHEIEQMGGMFFLARLSRLKRDMVLKRVEKLRRQG